MKSKTLIFLCFLISFISLGFSLKKPDEFMDWKDGDLIFHDSGRNIQTKAIMIATDSPYTHMGIIKKTKKGPVVIEAIGPVVETPLKSFIARGRNSAYTVYRLNSITKTQAQIILKEAQKYYGKPYDIFFRMDDERIYCSELPYKIFKKTGIKIGKPQKIKELNINNSIVKALVKDRWKIHPECKNMENIDQCWAVLMEQEIISPGQISKDPKLKMVYSTSSPF